MKPIYYTFATLSALALGSWTLPAAAQPSNIAPPGDSAVQPNQAFSQEELKTFAVASLDVERISDQYQTNLQEAADPDERQGIVAEAQEQMMQSVEQKGLSVDRYNSIVLAARGDQALSKQILTYRGEMPR
jgi:hypothetical protein